MKSQLSLPKFAKPMRGLRGWTSGDTHFGHVIRHKTAHKTHGPQAPFTYWYELYKVKVMQSNRMLHRLIVRTWKDALTAENRTNWQAAALTVNITNYKGKLKKPNGFQLFEWHHFFNSTIEMPSGFPWNWSNIAFQFDPPDPYVLPDPPHITRLVANSPAGFTVETDNWPADGDQVCLTSIQRVGLIQGKAEKTRQFTGKTASGTGTGGTGTLTIDALYPWEDPPTGSTFRFGLRYRKAGEGSQTKSPTIATPHYYMDATPWEDIDNVFVSDGNYASAHLIQSPSQWFPFTNGLWATGYGFTIPDDAVILGIKVHVQRRDTAAVVNYLAVNLLFNGNYVGAAKENDEVWPTTEAYCELGANNDDWNWNPTGTMIKDPTFGCELFGQIFYPDSPPPPYGEGFAAIDHVEIEVFFKLNANIPSNPTFYNWTRPAP